MSKKYLRQAIKMLNGQTGMANALTAVMNRKKPIRQSTVSSWLIRDKKGVPPHYCAALEKLTGIPRASFRPDVYGDVGDLNA